MTAAIDRVTFTTSRLLDFFSEKELTAQTGHGIAQWPLVILKELVDNALDACEEAQAAPEVAVTVDAEGITVADNGPGIPAETVAGVLDYSVRVSSREAYAAPDRGAQGNALKTIMAMPYVLDRSAASVTVTARGTRHDITVRTDQVRQVPVIDHRQHPADAKTGTRITVAWPDSASSILDFARPRFLQIAEDYAWLNPHLKVTVRWPRGGAGDGYLKFAPTAADWPKWRPSDPTSPHWYTAQQLERLIAAYVSHPAHQGMSVREFLTGFRGLTSSAKTKQVLAETGMTRTALRDLADGAFDSAAIAALLAAMRSRSRPVKPSQLGVIGTGHLAARFAAAGAEMDSYAYRKVEGEQGGQPYVVETAFAWRPDLGRRRLVTGVNWSPGLANQFRQLGKLGDSLDTLLERQRAGEDVILVIHLAKPVISYADRGKSAVIL